MTVYNSRLTESVVLVLQNQSYSTTLYAHRKVTAWQDLVDASVWTSLCRIEGKPPDGHLMACASANFQDVARLALGPQLLHSDGAFTKCSNAVHR